jgi:small-conductance mechanosensitive channel
MIATTRGRTLWLGWIARLVLLSATLMFVGTGVRAAEPPPGMSREQFDALVSAVADTLSKGLARPEAAKPAGGKDGPDEIDQVAQTVETLASRTPGILSAVPSLPGQTVAMFDRFDRTDEGGKSAGAFFRALVFCLVLLVGLYVGLGLLLRRTLVRLFMNRSSAAGLKPTALGAGLEVLRVVAVWIASRVCLGVAFAGAGSQTAFAALVLDSAVAVFAIRGLLEIWLRPGWPSARLIPVDDAQASRLTFGITAVATLVRVGQVWTALLTGETLVSAALLVNAVVVPLAYAWLAWTRRDVFGTWLAGTFGVGGSRSVARATRFWIGAIGIVIALVLLLRLYAALADRPDVPYGTIVTVTTLILLLFGETLIRWVLEHPEAAQARSDVEARLLRSGTRLARVAMLLFAAGFMARTWIVDSFQLVAPEDWSAASRHWWIAGFGTFLGFLAWEIVIFLSDPYVAKGSAAASDAKAGASGSRARTLAPLIRAALLALIIIVCGLTVLAILGVNITPLVAGASIFGLAISFGSQTLVRDIVSGVFYLAEDAFRVGEYIDCGKAKGTVEGFALRSLRLRHQNGQLHTIPFGQLGQVTNFSRDWATVKFNLRFARDTDLDALRKATKAIGQGLLDDPEFADAFIDPLKMQGVAEIADDALIVSFKFTVKPERPSEIQREAIRRLLRDLPAAGIRFAVASPTYIQLSTQGDISSPAPTPVTP